MKMAFVKALIEEAEQNSRLMLLTGDLGFQIFDRFQEKFGPRYVNVGVAEAQLVLAAAGLALTGWRPFTYSIASFATARCFEQIKLSVAYPCLPVVIVGAGGGYAYAHSGVTHHAGDDLALMRLLPGMTVLAPGDLHEVKALLPQILNLPGPTYLRLGRGKEPDYQILAPVKLGQARLLQEGEDIAILSTGEAAWEVWTALPHLAEQGLHPFAYQFHTVKPLDLEVLKYLAARVRLFVTVDEQGAIGGLGSAVAEWLAARGHAPRLLPLSVGDEFVLGSPHQRQVREHFGLNAAAIVRTLSGQG